MTEKDALAFQEDIRDDDKIFCLMEDEESPAKKDTANKASQSEAVPAF